MLSKTIQKARLYLLGVLFLCSFIFIRIYSASPVFLFQFSWDDSSYFIYTETILKNQNFDWCAPNLTNQDFFTECDAKKTSPNKVHAYNMYSPGPAVTMLPITSIGWLLHKLGIFTPTNVDVLVFWTMIASFVLFALGTLLLFECSLYFLKNVSAAFWWTVFFTIGNAMLYYVFRRPALSHTAEYFLFFASLYSLIKIISSKKIILWSLILGFLTGIMMITRFNNIHIPIIIGIMLLFWPGENWRYNRWQKIAACIVGGLPPILLLFWVNYLQNGTFFYKPENYYEEYTLSFFLKFYWVNIYRIFLWFFGTHWGMFWIMPIYLIEAYFFTKYRKEITKLIQKKYYLPLALITIIILVHLNMMANGPSTMSYAYRHIFSYYFFIHILFLLFLTKLGLTTISKKLKIACLIAAIIGSAHIINFESNATDLTLTAMPPENEGILHPFWKNGRGLVAPHYVLHSYEHLLKGKPILNLAASPSLGYAILAASDLGFRIPSAMTYYEGSSRKIFHFSDLRLLFEYQLWYLISVITIYFSVKNSRIFKNH